MNLDLIIRGGTVVDGSGREPARLADVGVVGDRLVAIGDLSGAVAAEVVDATGQVVCPGFIDPHIHSEIALLGGRHRYGALLQGVTTHLLAPDGFGWAPLPPEQCSDMWDYTLFSHGHADLPKHWPTAESYLSIFPGKTPANVVPQVPHCAVRLAAVGWEGRSATAAEVAQMADITREWMEAGAAGLCAGLDYQPSAFASTEELIALCKVVSEYGGVYASHLRYNILGREAAWREHMEIGRRAGVGVHVSHESVGDVTEVLLEEAESTDCDLTFESYMYPAGCTHLALSLPNWAQQGGYAAIRRRLSVPAQRQQMQEALEARLSQGEWDRLVFVATQTGRYVGQSMTDVAAAEGVSLGELAMRILAEEEPYALMIFHRRGTEAEHQQMVRRTIRHPKMMVGSDGVYHGEHGHPRGYGCYARVLRLGVRELGAVSLEAAVYKMAGFPAKRFGLRDRGLLRTGYAADLVIFDPATVSDRSTWDHPWTPPVGIDRVLVNGQTVVLRGQPTGAMPGQVVRARH